MSIMMSHNDQTNQMKAEIRRASQQYVSSNEKVQEPQNCRIYVYMCTCIYKWFCDNSTGFSKAGNQEE